MPELPEVETIVNGIKPHVKQKTIQAVIVRHKLLRYPVPKNLNQLLSGQTIQQVSRRGKYILLHCDEGMLIIHLGMSGYLRCLKSNMPAAKHDHLDILFTNGDCLRYTDPRRFGAILWNKGDAFDHPCLKSLGVEPLTSALTAEYLLENSRNRRCSIKQYIMDNKVIVGVGNIYANESLFEAAINPATVANKLTLLQYQNLVKSIQSVLRAAIKRGGTTFKDFQSSSGKPGYFQHSLKVYGRAGEKCLQCGTMLNEIRQGQRSTVYCRHCQQRR